MTSVRLRPKAQISKNTLILSLTALCFYLGIDCGVKFRSGRGVTEDLRNTLHKMSRKTKRRFEGFLFGDPEHAGDVILYM